ncbi:hypothetical protein HDU67_010330 [Dinochytrium kinnereticum]|nr:hypothetical protein HDU67_010330 [Dinochytrium kinnereticum]
MQGGGGLNPTSSSMVLASPVPMPAANASYPPVGVRGLEGEVDVVPRQEAVGAVVDAADGVVAVLMPVESSVATATSTSTAITTTTATTTTTTTTSSSTLPKVLCEIM